MLLLLKGIASEDAVKEDLGRIRKIVIVIVVIASDVVGDKGSELFEGSEGCGGGLPPKGEGVGGDEEGSAGPRGGGHGECEKP